jgi:hypothetical protein
MAKHGRGFVLALIGWILLPIAAAGVYELWRLARAPRWAPLGLTAQMAEGAIHLVWNPDSRPARGAVRGVLTIDDGKTRPRIELTAAQVRGGRFDYRPASADVLFRLEFFGEGLEAAGDSLQVISGREAAAAAVSAPPQPAPPEPEKSADREASYPEAVREIQPTIPEGILARITNRVVVPVEVKVAASGKVTSASAQGSGDGLYQYLADRAKQAAMEWRFSPARSRRGKAVAAVRTVYFEFTGPH